MVCSNSLTPGNDSAQQNATHMQPVIWEVIEAGMIKSDKALVLATHIFQTPSAPTLLHKSM